MAKANAGYVLGAGLLLSLSVGACATTRAPHGYSAKAAPGVQVIAPAEADAAGLSGTIFQLAYGDVPGDQGMVTHFLGAARQRGAAFVSNIEVHVVDDKDGRWEECVTRLLPSDRGSRRETQRFVPSHYDEVAVPVSGGPTQFSETRLVCPRQDSNAGGCIQTTGSGGSRDATVYHTERRFVQAHWESEVRWVSDWKLEETRPTCAPVQHPLAANAPARLVRATVYTR
jgi:hypothetical protein